MNGQIDYKQRDTEKIVAFLKDRDRVNVEDIITGSGAEKLRVYPILAELSFAGRIRVVEEGKLGEPLVVAMSL